MGKHVMRDVGAVTLNDGEGVVDLDLRFRVRIPGLSTPESMPPESLARPYGALGNCVVLRV